MKLLHFSDLHIGMENYAKLDPQTGLSTRLLDFFQTFDFIVEKAFAEEVDCVVFAGDAYKTRDPNPTQQRGFGERISKLAKKIPVVLVVGNHDTPNAEGKANTLDIYSALEIDNVWVSRKPEYLEVPTKSGVLQVITLPWLHKHDYKTIGEKLQLLYQKIKNPPAAPESIEAGGPAILVSHCEVVGAQYGSEKGMAIANDVTIPLSLIQDRRLTYCALGHIHKHQVLSKPGDSPLVVYSGSPQRIDFGEEKEEKGICLVEIRSVIPAPYQVRGKLAGIQLTDKNHGSRIPLKARLASGGKSGMTNNVQFKFIPTNARQFLTITINLKGSDSSPTQTILDEIAKHDVKDKIVRVIINIPADLEQDLEMDKIKKTLSDAHVIAGISRNVERRERLRLEGAAEVERLTPIDALRAYFEAKKYSKEKQKELEQYAAKLLE